MKEYGRSFAGDILETLEALDNLVKEAERGHVCGLQGFNPMLGDRCPECETKRLEREAGDKIGGLIFNRRTGT